jgi:hypothetical protein
MSLSPLAFLEMSKPQPALKAPGYSGAQLNVT